MGVSPRRVIFQVLERTGLLLGMRAGQSAVLERRGAILVPRHNDGSLLFSFANWFPGVLALCLHGSVLMVQGSGRQTAALEPHVALGLWFASLLTNEFVEHWSRDTEQQGGPNSMLPGPLVRKMLYFHFFTRLYQTDKPSFS